MPAWWSARERHVLRAGPEHGLCEQVRGPQYRQFPRVLRPQALSEAGGLGAHHVRAARGLQRPEQLYDHRLLLSGAYVFTVYKTNTHA